MLNTESPIKEIDEDALERKHFSKNLSDAILKYYDKFDNSFTIGIYGKWGSGKTSIIVMLEKYFNKTKKEKQIIFEFKPWIYSSEQKLIEIFFNELNHAINNNDPRNFDLREKISVYANNIVGCQHQDYSKNQITKKFYRAWNFLKTNKVSRFIFSNIASMSDKHFGTELKSLNKEDQISKLEKLKDDVDDKLKMYNILCIIDDIDRLSDNEIRDVFKLVNNIANFKNIIFLLAFDQKIVSEALNDTQDNKGYEYLEKIINMPLIVPMITIDEIRKSFKNNLKETVDKFNVKNFEEGRWNNFFYKNTNIMSFFKNLRDVKRFFNIFNFNYNLINIDVNFVDLLALTLIQTFKPEIYQNIIKNEKLLTSYFIYTDDFRSIESIARNLESKPVFGSDDLRIFYKDFKKKIDEEKSEFLEDILDFLFPQIIKTNNIWIENSFFDSFDENLNVCHYNHFRTYFKLDPKYKSFTEKDIKKYIKILYNPNEIIFLLEELKSKNMIYPFLDVLKNRLNILDRTFEHEIISSLYTIEDYIIKNHKYYFNTPISKIMEKLVNNSIISYKTIYSYWETSTNLLSDLILFEHITKEKENLKYREWINDENYEKLKNVIVNKIENFKEEYAENYSYSHFYQVFWILKNLNKYNVNFERDIFNDFFFNDLIIVAFLHDIFLEILKKYDNLYEVKDEEIITVMDYLIKYQNIDSISQKIENLDRSKEEYKDFIDKLIYLFERGKYLSLSHVIFMKNCKTIV